MTPITLGIEEELMIVDPGSGEVIADPDPAIFDDCRRAAGGHRVVNELLRSQIETNSRICSSIAELRTSLHEMRRLVVNAARAHGAAVIASSTHPWARWQAQQVTPKRRYQEAEIAFQQRRPAVLRGRHAPARRIRRPGPEDPGDDGVAAVSAGVPGDIDLVAVLCGADDRPQVVPPSRNRRDAANRDAKGIRLARGVRAHRGAVPVDPRHPGRERAPLGHPALGVVPDHRASDLRHLPAHRGCGRDRLALCLPHPLPRAEDRSRREVVRAAAGADRGRAVAGPTVRGPWRSSPAEIRLCWSTSPTA